MQKYVWWDEIEARQRARLDLRMPKALHDFLQTVAKRNCVSMNALVVGMLGWAADAEEHRRLRVEVVPAVRVTDRHPGSAAVVVPVPSRSPSDRKRWDPIKVL